MAEQTSNNSPSLDPNFEILKMTRSQKAASFKKVYNLYKGLKPENQGNAGQNVGNTAQTSESA